MPYGVSVVTTPARPRLLYQHIPRTAGSSVRTALAAAYQPHEIAFAYDDAAALNSAEGQANGLDAARSERVRMVVGDFAYGFHDQLPGPSRYITMVANPLVRVLSLYRSLRQASGDAEFPTFIRWLEEEDVRADNGMVRQLSGQTDVPFGHCADSMLEQALANIDASYDAVLVRGRMQAAREELARVIGRDLPGIGRENESPTHPTIEDLVPKARARLNELNALDGQLFRTMIQRADASSVPRSGTTARTAGTAPRSKPARRFEELPIGDQTLLFMHVAKTGGTSVRTALAEAYDEGERAFVYDPGDLSGALRHDEIADLPEAQRQDLRLVIGHFRYGLHRAVGRPCRYVAIIRDPVERVVSLYYHYLHLRGAWLSRLRVPGVRRDGASREEQHYMRRNKLSLEEWVFDQRRLTVDNGMTRAIAARGQVKWGSCPDDLLDQALANVQRDFVILLPTPELDHAAPVLTAITGRDIEPVPRRNANTKRPPKEELDPRVAERIRELNRLDQKLYETALRRFDALQMPAQPQ